MCVINTYQINIFLIFGVISLLIRTIAIDSHVSCKRSKKKVDANAETVLRRNVIFFYNGSPLISPFLRLHVTRSSPGQARESRARAS